MPITFACPHCSRSISVRSEWAGRKATCPGCQQNLVIPAESPQPASVVEVMPAVPGPAAPPAPAAEESVSYPDEFHYSKRRSRTGKVEDSAGEDRLWFWAMAFAGLAVLATLFSPRFLVVIPIGCAWLGMITGIAGAITCARRKSPLAVAAVIAAVVSLGVGILATVLELTVRSKEARELKQFDDFFKGLR
jgi:hypothetical protein